MNVTLLHVSSYGSRYYKVEDEKGCCSIKVRVSSHRQQDHNRSSFGGVHYNLYYHLVENLDEEFAKLIARTHEKKFAKVKPKSRWVRASKICEEYPGVDINSLDGLVWYKRNSPFRAAVLRQSIEDAIRAKKEREKEKEGDKNNE